jgi:hypothetical protein
VEIFRRNLFESEILRIGLFEAFPDADVCGEVERRRSNAVVLPLIGVFSKHDARQVRHRHAAPRRFFLHGMRRTGSDFPALLVTGR